MLKVNNLSFSYGSKKILDDINFACGAGEFVGLLGANGSGKSTLFKSILGILRPQGSVYIDGNDRLDPKHRARLVGYIPQKSGLLMPLSVMDFVLMGLYSQNGFSGYGREQRRLATEVLDELDIASFANRSVLSLSGGEFSRVLMARALIARPKILLLDEPVAALDLSYAIFLMQKCAQLAARGVLVVMIIHELNLASKFCSRFIALKGGKIAVDGGIDDMYQKSQLKEIFDLDCEILRHDGRILLSY